MTRRGVAGLVVGALVVSLFSMVAGEVAGGLLLVSWALGCSIVLALKVRKFAPEDRLPWILVAGATLAISVGILVRGIHGALIEVDQPLPSPAELLHIPGYLMFFAAALVIHRRRATTRSPAAWLDSAAILLGTLIVIWIGFLGTFVLDSSIPLVQRLLNLLYNGVTLATFAVFLRISATPGYRPRSYYLLGTAGALFFLVDIAGSSSGGVYLSVVLSPLVFALILAAAFDPSAERIADRDLGAEEKIGYARLGLLSFTIAAPLATYLIPSSLENSTLNTAFLTSVTLTLAVAVLTRTGLLLIRNQRANDLERRFAEEVSALAAVTKPSDVHPALLAGATRLLGTGSAPRFVSPNTAEGHTGIIAKARFAGSEPVVLIAEGSAGNTHESRVIKSLLSEGSSLMSHLEQAEQLAEAKLREKELTVSAVSEKRFRSLLQNSTDAIAVFDSNGIVTFVTGSVERLLGYKPDQLIGSTLEAITHGNDWAYAIKHVKAVFAGDETMREYELRAISADGTVRLLECFLTDMRHIEGIDGMVMNVSDSTAVRALESDLKNASTTDPLTLVLNRTAFIDETDAAIRRASVRSRSVALAIINLDDFRSVNEAHGSAIADLALVEVSERIKHAARSNDPIARLSGAEFGVLLPDGYSIEKAESVVERILADIEEPIEIEGHAIVLTATAGLVVDEDLEGDALTILSRADTALDVAKRTQRGGVLHFDSKMGAEASIRIGIRNSLLSALRNDKLRLNFQPVVDMETGRIVSLEALSRWHDDVLGEISPGTFIPIAESGGMIGELGDWALRQACKHLSEWTAMGMDDFTVSVNMSGHQLRDNSLIDSVRAVLDETKIDPSRLLIELTESVLLDDTDFTAARLRKLRQLGLQLAIDDFGTGYSSFSYLRRYEFDVLKIDRSFIVPLADDKNTREREIVNAMIKLSQALGAVAVAEGIEENEEYAVLRTLGCDRAQGFLFYRPLEASDISDVLLERAKSDQIFDLGDTAG